MFGFVKADSPRVSYQRIAVVLFCIALVVVVILVVMNMMGGPERKAHVSPLALDSKAEGDRLAIMNILNRYNAEENVAQGKNKDTSAKSRVERIVTVENQLRALTVDDSLNAVRDKLVTTFELWRQSLISNQDLQPVRQQFIALGNEYAWLNTLVWLIVLNRL